MTDKKYSLIIIILLLVIFLPITTITTIKKINDKSNDIDNKEHKFKYMGYLWFYDQNDVFISKYECQTDNCDLAKSTINDGEYGINYYKEDEEEDNENNNNYIFITDGDLVYLYNIEKGDSLISYKSIKNYDTKLLNNLYIVENNEELWGVIQIDENPNLVVPFEYNFIGITKIEDDLKFIVLKDSEWYMIDKKSNRLTEGYTNPIVDYNSKYIFIKANDKIKIFDFNNNSYLNNLNIIDYVLYEEYIGVVINNYMFVYGDLENQYLKLVNLTDKEGKISFTKENNILNVKVNDEIIDTIEI